jgi:LysR family hydrogen peroxide-inducible transcriptional activator
LLVEEKSDVLLQRLREGKLDAALLALPLHDEQLHAQFLFEEPFLLAAPNGHPLVQKALAQKALTQKAQLTSADLNDNILLLLEDGHCLRDQALDVCRLAGAQEKSGFRATSLETLRQMVAAGVGVTLLPQLAVHPSIAQPAGVTLVPFRKPAPSRSIALVWRKSSALENFLHQLAPVLADCAQAQLDNA